MDQRHLTDAATGSVRNTDGVYWFGKTYISFFRPSEFPVFIYATVNGNRRGPCKTSRPTDGLDIYVERRGGGTLSVREKRTVSVFLKFSIRKIPSITFRTFGGRPEIAGYLFFGLLRSNDNCRIQCISVRAVIRFYRTRRHMRRDV